MKEIDHKMRNRKRLFGIYLPFFLLLILGAIALKTVATIGFFNNRYDYFTNRTIPLIGNILIAVSIVSFIIYIIATQRSIKLIPSFSSPANYIPSAAVSAALVFMILHFFGVFKRGLSLSNIYDTPLTSWLAIILAVLAGLSIVYFVLNTIFIRTVSARRANYGLFVIIFLALYLAYLYFDQGAPINSPIKIADQLAYAFASVFFLYEVRLSLGREKWKAYIIFGFAAAALCAYSSIPSLITYFAKSKTVISNSIYESILTFTLFLFISLKLLLTDKLVENSEDPFIEKLKEAAEKRASELMPTAEESEEATEEAAEEIPDENQISILDIESLPVGENTEEENEITDTEE